MPEGHSIHRIARQISDVFTGEHVRFPPLQGRYAEGAALLDGHTITGAYAHGVAPVRDFRQRPDPECASGYLR